MVERQSSEDALRHSERDYRGLFEQAHDAIIVLAPDEEIVLDVNQRACEVYGFSRAEFIGLSLEKISRNVKHGKEQIKETLEAGKIFDGIFQDAAKGMIDKIKIAVGIRLINDVVDGFDNLPVAIFALS